MSEDAAALYRTLVPHCATTWKRVLFLDLRPLIATNFVKS